MKKSEADQLFRQAVKLRLANEAIRAEKALQQIVFKLPSYKDIHYVYNELGLIALNSKKLEEAKAYFEKAIQASKGYGDPLCNLGCLFGILLDYDRALEYYCKALEINREDEAVLSNVIKIHLLQNRMPEVLQLCQQTLRINPRNLAALKGLGDYYQQQKELDKARQYYNQALAISPNSVDFYYHLGDIETSSGRMTKAVEYYEKVMHACPNRAEPYNQLGRALLFCGKHAAARGNFEKALKCGTDVPAAVTSNILLSWNYEYNVDLADIYQRHVQYNEFFKDLPAMSIHKNEVIRNRKLRIGYISGDFRGHPVSFFIIPILTYHDKNNFEIICYSNAEAPDKVTEQIQTLVHGWRDISQLSEDDVAALIEQDAVDILVDLSGHTAGNSLPVFARKPAPVQVTWIGYPNTTGLNTMDYRITDAYADPIGVTDQYHTEKLLRMPHSFLCYAPLESAPECKPRQYSEQEIVFGCFNNFTKVTDEIVSAWCQILTRAAQSKLVLKSMVFADEQIAAAVLERFKAQGIDPTRVVILARDASSEKHLDRYNTVDIALDTYPYHGTTTTCEALFMGVPVITLAGDRHAARVGVSLLTNIGVPELIADSIEEYIEKACALASDNGRLCRYKDNLRQMMRNSPLMDAKQFTMDLEAEYRKMWIEWCRKQESQGEDQVVRMANDDKMAKTCNLLSVVKEKTVFLLEKLASGCNLGVTIDVVGDIVEELAVIQASLAQDNFSNENIAILSTERLNAVLRVLLWAYEQEDVVNVQDSLQKLAGLVEELLELLQATPGSEQKTLIEKINQFPFWYHKIELPGGIVTPGWAPLNKDAYRIPEDLTGLRVLDVGAWDGFWTFEALKRGAKQVVAIDDFSDFLGSLNNSDRRAWETFDLCKAALGYNDEQCQRYDMSVYDISKEQLGEFDIVFFFGTLYHLRHPLLALDKLASVCKREIYVETAILDDYSPFRGGIGKGYPGNQIVAEFYSGDQYGGNDTNWWVPTVHCLAHLVLAAGFKDVNAWKLTDNPQELPYCRGFAHGKK